MRDESFAEFVTVRWSALYRTAYLLAGDTVAAEDLLQTSLLKAYVSWQRVMRSDVPEAYLRTIIVNTFLSARRRRGLPVTSIDTTAGLPVPSPETDLLDRLHLWQHVRRLPPRQRAVVVLRYYEDMTEREIAEALGCSTGTVKSQASDALASLRRRLTPPATPASVQRAEDDAGSPPHHEARP